MRSGYGDHDSPELARAMQAPLLLRFFQPPDWGTWLVLALETFPLEIGKWRREGNSGSALGD